LALPEPSISPHIRARVDKYFDRLAHAVVGQNYDDTLFFASPGWWRYAWSPYLATLAQLNLTPTTVLDIGCGDGLLVNFPATVYPDANIVALDRCATCLVTTKTIASRLGSRNLRVVQADASELPSLFPQKTLDLVTCRAFTSFGTQCSCSRLLGDPVSATHPVVTVNRILTAVHEILKPDAGLFISTESCSTAPQVWSWAAQIAAARFEVDWTRSRGVPTAGRRWTMLVCRAVSTPTRISLGDVLGLLVDAEIQDIGRPGPLTGYLAEAIFTSLVIDGFIFGFHASFNGVVLRRELRSARDFIVSFDLTNAAERELRFWPPAAASHLRTQLEEEAEKLKGQGWTVLRFRPTDKIPVNREDMAPE
jgi:SAM-dependent methyltransferase